MNIVINLNHAFQPFAGNRETVEVAGNTVKECLDSIISLYPVFREILFDADGILQVLVFHGGKLVVPDELDRPVSGRGDLLLTPMIQGG